MTPTVTTAGDLVHTLRDGGAAAYDVTVIGAGVVGTALARELARYPIRTALVDGSDDIGNGTSKANTAIRFRRRPRLTGSPSRTRRAAQTRRPNCRP
ncbi:FAD-dependent oxidoreductase [Streptomyces sp. NPDC005151]